MNDVIYIYPTDTVWGIGGNIYSDAVCEKIASIKGRDKDKPLSILFNSIESLKEYFDLPAHIGNQWLQDFFKLESTALLPKSWAIKEIPLAISRESLWVGVRCLMKSNLDEMFQEVKGPIITTSLNQSGEAPIIRMSEAKTFKDKFAPEAHLVEMIGDKLSGSPSSIVKFENDGKSLFLREGNYAQEIKQHMRLLST